MQQAERQRNESASRDTTKAGHKKVPSRIIREKVITGDEKETVKVHNTASIIYA